MKNYNQPSTEENSEYCFINSNKWGRCWSLTPIFVRSLSFNKGRTSSPNIAESARRLLYFACVSTYFVLHESGRVHWEAKMINPVPHNWLQQISLRWILQEYKTKKSRT